MTTKHHKSEPKAPEPEPKAPEPEALVTKPEPVVPKAKSVASVTAYWSSLVLYLFRQVSRRFGPLGAAALALGKDHVLALTDGDEVPPVATPEALKKLIVDYLSKKVDQAVGNQVVAMLLKKVLSAVDDVLVNAAWAWLFSKKAVGVAPAAFGIMSTEFAEPDFRGSPDAEVYDAPLYEAACADLAE